MTGQPAKADLILAAAEERIAADGYDAGTVVACALEALAEAWAEDDRPLCPVCGRRRISRGASSCQWCEQNYEAQLLWKMRWWNEHGSAARTEQRQAAR